MNAPARSSRALRCCPAALALVLALAPQCPTARQAPVPPAAAPAWTVRFPMIDLNRASVAELRRLPGVGATIAERIVQTRRRRGPFARIEDLDAVPGIGPRTLERVRPYVRASRP